MIAVAGFNAAIDKLLEVGELRAGEVNRARAVSAWPGGKGLHVAHTIAVLGEPVRLVGLVDSKHAAEFERLLSASGVESIGIDSGGELRTNLAIRDDGGRVTEILEPGPQLSAAAAARLTAAFVEAGRQSAVAVLSGSVPRGLEDATYHDLIAALRADGVRCLLDASGAPLRQGLAAGPYLVKPNRDEAEVLLGGSIDGTEPAIAAAAAIGERGAARVVLTLGADGAVANWEGRRCRIAISAVRTRNPVGSGDCFLGGAAVGIARGLEPTEVLRLAAACGARCRSSGSTLGPEGRGTRRCHAGVRRVPAATGGRDRCCCGARRRAAHRVRRGHAHARRRQRRRAGRPARAVRVLGNTADGERRVARVPAR
jgi:tagatose 6-phosphate kinase